MQKERLRKQPHLQHKIYEPLYFTTPTGLSVFRPQEQRNPILNY